MLRLPGSCQTVPPPVKRRTTGAPSAAAAARSTSAAASWKRPMTALILAFEDGHELRYSDARRMGRWYLVATSDLATVPQMAELGPDALEVDEEKVASTAASMLSLAVEKPDARLQIVRIMAVSSDPDDAMLLANAMAKGAVIYGRTEALKMISDIDRAVQTRIAAVEADLTAVAPLVAPIAETEKRVQELSTRLAEVEKDMAAQRVRAEQLAARIRDLQSGDDPEQRGLSAA